MNKDILWTCEYPRSALETTQNPQANTQQQANILKTTNKSPKIMAVSFLQKSLDLVFRSFVLQTI